MMTEKKADTHFVSKFDQFLEKDFLEVQRMSEEDLIKLELFSPVVKMIVNFTTQGYEYVSDNTLKVLGVSADEIIKLTIQDSARYFKEEDFKLLVNEIFPLILFWYQKYYILKKDSYKTRISYNLYMKDKAGKIFGTTHILRPLKFDESGNPLLSAKYILTSKDNKKDIVPEVKFEEESESGEFQIVWSKTFSPGGKKDVKLSDREKEILNLVSKGYSSKEIADKLFLSLYTINNHRRRIARKCKVKNLFEAITLLNE